MRRRPRRRRSAAYLPPSNLCSDQRGSRPRTHRLPPSHPHTRSGRPAPRERDHVHQQCASITLRDDSGTAPRVEKPFGLPAHIVFSGQRLRLLIVGQKIVHIRQHRGESVHRGIAAARNNHVQNRPDTPFPHAPQEIGQRVASNGRHDQIAPQVKDSRRREEGIGDLRDFEICVRPEGVDEPAILANDGQHHGLGGPGDVRARDVGGIDPLAASSLTMKSPNVSLPTLPTTAVAIPSFASPVATFAAQPPVSIRKSSVASNWPASGSAGRGGTKISATRMPAQRIGGGEATSGLMAHGGRPTLYENEHDGK